MKHILILIFLTISALACTGDCMTCHPKLVPTINEDLRHKPMLTCINCHSAKASSMAECGDKCFSCHPIAKIKKANVREHDIIQTCVDCHVGANDKLFDIFKPLNQSYGNTLKDFLDK
jgi:formate-dependent nitrite reductase cytochrome c552 subunit